MTRVNVKKSNLSFRAAMLLASSLTLAGMIAPTANAGKRQAAPVVFASSGGSPAPVATTQNQSPQVESKRKRFSFGRRKSSDNTKRAAVPAEPTRRTEFRYPDQPNTFYGEEGTRTVANADPLSFSSSKAAVTQEVAASMTVGARPNLPAITPIVATAPARDPAITSGGFDARAAAADVEARTQFVSAAGPADFTSPTIISKPLPPVKTAPVPLGKLQTVSVATQANTDDSYDKTGAASVFDRALHGQPTSNGEILDTLSMTAAHPTLPLPSLVQVINLDNGKEVVVRVNDRGPIGGNGLIEVSEKAADVLGFDAAGHANVRVRYLGDAPSVQTQDVKPAAPLKTRKPENVPLLAEAPRVPSAASGQFMVQLASFSDIGNAQRMYESLNGRLGNIGIVSANVNGSDYFRIVAGPLNDRKSAESLRDQLARQGVGQGLVITAP